MASVEMTSLDQVSHSRRASSVVGTDCIVDIENGVDEVRISFEISERDCRICMLSFDSEFGIAIDLGCCCKNELAAVHQHCAEQWFIIKGNNVCEICHSIAQNVVIPYWRSQVNTSSTNAVSVPVIQVNTSSTDAVALPRSSTDTVVSPRYSTNAVAVPVSSSARMCGYLLDVILGVVILMIFIIVVEFVGWFFHKNAN